MPIMPPDWAAATITESGIMRLEFQTPCAPAWLITVGLVLAAMASSEVRSPACETSTTMPSSFMRAIAARPKAVSPVSS